MVHLSILLVALLGAQSLAKQCGTKAECDRQCAENHTAGWKCTDYSDGDCQQCGAVACLGEGDAYTDPKTGKTRCCDNKEEHWSYDSEIRQGLCCAKDKKFSVDRKHKKAACCPKGEPPHHFSYDPKTGMGFCCEEGYIFKDGMCVYDDHKHEKCGKEICPDDDGDLHLEYGKCYRLKNPEGHALHLSGNDYRWNPSEGSSFWQFRVCKDTTNCARDGTVREGDTFVLNDVIGGNSKDEKPWWMCTGVHYLPCTDTNRAKKFSATKWCDAEHCGICLKGDFTGVGPVCPTTNRAIGDHPNPNFCTPILVEEVRCIAPNPVAGDEHSEL